MLVRVETSRVGPAWLPSAASWRASSSFAYRIHRRSGRSGGDDAHLPENAREFVWDERVTQHDALARPTRRMKKCGHCRGRFLRVENIQVVDINGGYKGLFFVGLASKYI